MKLFALAVLIAVQAPAHAFLDPGEPVHGKITEEALSTLISAAGLKVIILANESQDAPGSEAAGDARRHFAGSSLSSAIAYIDREKKLALNYACEADSDEESRVSALRHFGLLLHSVQDFYSSTNYVELMLESGYQADPFSMPLVDWGRVPEGYPGLSGAGPQPSGAVFDFNKNNSNTSAGGSVVREGINRFAVARELAVRETQRQWNLFEALIRGRLGDRALAVLAALKQAAPGMQVSREVP